MSTGAKRVSVERWLRENEGRVVPMWVSEFRRKGGIMGEDTTQELRHHIYLLYYDRLCHAVASGNTEDLERMLHRLLSDQARQNYDIRQILQFPLQLKSTLWGLIFGEFPPDQAQEMVEELDPVLDLSVEVLVKAYTDITESALNEQLEELDFLTQRLAISSEETESAFMQLRSLYNISRTISSTLDIHQTLEAIAENLVSLEEIERCTIWLLTSSNVLQVGVTKGPGDTPMASLTLPVEGTMSFVTQALVTRKQQRYEDETDVLASFLTGRQAVAIPMFNENRAVGVVMISGTEGGGRFASSAINLIQAATEQAAVALENAQLYGQVMRFNQELEEKVRQRTAELQEINVELARVNEDLERLDKTKSDFISIAAHELKTPLTLILGYTNIMRDDSAIKGNAFLVNILQGIVKGSERLYGIIESMIDVSLIDSQVLQLRPAQTSIGNLMRTLAEQYEKDLKERRITLKLGNFSALPYIEADSQRLYQVFDNLVVNAIKYTPDGGQVSISGTSLRGREDGDWIEIIVADTGIGIDPEHLDRIFDKFYQTGEVALHSTGRTKFKGGGPGLGLAIAKGIVEAHGGRIWAESEKHDEDACPGSEFHVILPVKSLIRVGEISSPFSYARN
jgi:signal transduction histidine kinase